MAIIIDQPDAVRFLQELVAVTGENDSDAVTRALREGLARELEKRANRQSMADDLLRIGRECAALPILDDRTPEAILGYRDGSILGETRE